jgi:PKD repeat protein
VVTLTATPASGRHFIGWSGDCTGKALTCQVTMDKARSVTATFAENVPPVAAFTFAPATALTGQAVAFDGSGSSDSDGTVVSYAWSFGASGVKATNGFPTPGTFEVTLTVTDDSGATGSVTHAVPVSLPPVIAPPAAAVLPISLQCTTRRLVLIDVLQQAGKVVLLGAADPKLAGQTVNLTLAASGTTVATAIVGADGTFQTTAPLPAKKIRNTNAARYRATVGAEQSDFLKLTRRMQVDSLSAAGGQVTIKGRITKPLGKKVQRVQVRQRVSCQQTKVVKSFKPPASGRFSVTFPAPTGQSQAIYTLTTKVRKNTRNPKLFPTASLPRPVTLGG